MLLHAWDAVHMRIEEGSPRSCAGDRLNHYPSETIDQHLVQASSPQSWLGQLCQFYDRVYERTPQTGTQAQ